jgi:hypothetical protein
MTRVLVVVVCAALIAPAAACAQGPKVGMVTTLKGTVTARRAALQDPVTLQFKDDVFQDDTITTAEKSLARMLLGSKTVVTLCDRSVVTIASVPGPLPIALETGKLALAVASEKLRSGEQIQIRTPNALADVRGTVVIAEVTPLPTPADARASRVTTRFSVLRGTITVQPLDPATGQPAAAQLTIGKLET